MTDGTTQPAVDPAEGCTEARTVARTVARPASGPATVRAVDGEQLRLEPHGAATLAVPDYVASPGDQVVCLVDETGAAWVVGVLGRAPTPLLDAALSEAPARDPGGRGKATDTGPTEVRDKRGRLLFEYDPERDVATLHAAAGDLELSVPRGALRVNARDGVEMHTEGTLSLSASREISLDASRGEGASARLRMQPGETSLTSAVLSAAADRTELLATRLQVRAHRVESHVERAKHVVKVAEVRAGRLVERARDVYREVEGLSQTRAGRLKLVAKKAAQLVGENTLIKARDRMKVKGERIHLA